MSVMDPHIRVLRAEAKAIAITLQAIAEGRLPGMPSTYETLYALRDAKIAAADALEAEEPKLREETPVNYNPKGKP